MVRYSMTTELAFWVGISEAFFFFHFFPFYYYVQLAQWNSLMTGSILHRELLGTKYFKHCFSSKYFWCWSPKHIPTDVWLYFFLLLHIIYCKFCGLNHIFSVDQTFKNDITGISAQCIPELKSKCQPGLQFSSGLRVLFHLSMLAEFSFLWVLRSLFSCWLLSG